ncbi:MAG TPA: indole-3-glycerol phosphate synthase TrpC [Candidatus Altiarchaeales archaeon]|nr:indole-3-glycerol phosphate synthase TrpC [Candidatus Altiarchaeales archaeon]
MSFIDGIVSEKQALAAKKKLEDFSETCDFKRRSLSESIKSRDFGLIAEIKKASPTLGKIREVDAAETARIYEDAGVSAISVLTEEKHFGGSLNDLKRVKEAISIPVIRKDFIVDKAELYEARAYGADAVLLIAAILGGKTRDFVGEARKIGLECLVEVHDESEVKHAIESGAKLIGINNRNLETLEIDMKTVERIAPLIPADRIIIAESGVKDRTDVLRMRKAGAKAALVGSSVMQAEDAAGKIRELMGK